MPIEKNQLIKALGKNIESFEVNSLTQTFESNVAESDLYLDGECYLSCFEKGVSLTFKENLLSSIHLRLDNKDNYNIYKGWISDYFDNEKQSLEDVINLSGKPTLSGGGGEGFMGAIDSFWLRYDHEEYSIHYTFTNDRKRISLITIMTSKV